MSKNEISSQYARKSSFKGWPIGLRNPLPPVVGATSLVACIGLVLAYVAYMRRYVLHDIPLTAACTGQVHDTLCSMGRLSYYTVQHVRHHGPLSSPSPVAPLLLIHDAGLAASSYEMKPLYEHYAHERTVYALDLPGFGFSERGALAYSPLLYRDAINEFLASVLHGTPVDAVAFSLGAEFLALAAEHRPEQFRTLTFITPTGFSRADAQRRPSKVLLHWLLHPSWRRLIYDTLTSRIGLRNYLGSLQRHPTDRSLLHYAYVTSHQPGAEYAPLHTLSGALNTPDIFSVYQSLSQPVLMLYGQSVRAHFDLVDDLHTQLNWRIVEYKRCGDLVHFDDLHDTLAWLDQHLKNP